MSATSMRVVIVGGGAGGLVLAIRLARQGDIQVFLVDQSAAYIGKPRLHEMAAGARRGMVDEMEYAGLAERGGGVVFVQGGLRDVDPAARRIELDAMSDARDRPVVGPRDLNDDILVLGGVTPDLGVDGMTEHAFMLEREAVRTRLEQAGVTIHTGCQISRVASDHVEADDGSRFGAKLTVWATGRVGPPVVEKIDALAANDKRQWRVRKTLQSVTRPDVFALGDCAAVAGSEAPPTAQVASEQATHLARELPRYCAGKMPHAFEYRHRGPLMSRGAAGAVGRLRGGFGRDLQVRNRLAAAAYRGFECQNEMVVLGTARPASSLALST